MGHQGTTYQHHQDSMESWDHHICGCRSESPVSMGVVVLLALTMLLSRKAGLELTGWNGFVQSRWRIVIRRRR